MKKIIVFLFIVVVITIFSNKNEELLVPKESIRFRIIASSNSAVDQALKLDVKKRILSELETIENNSQTITDSRIAIANNINKIENKLNTLGINYKINFGQNYFPIKTYNNITYDAGNYESLVITLGDGLGDNWWCILFPPLCLIEAKENKLSTLEYKLYINEILANYN